jgi:hypothetical protein
MPFQEDIDWKYLDRIIALADDIFLIADAIIEITDDPDVIIQARNIQAAGLQIEKRSRAYRPRLKELKQNPSPPSGRGSRSTPERSEVG